MKNILIMIPMLTTGGAERVASNLSLYLPKNKYNIVLLVHDGSKMDYPFEGELIDLESLPSKSFLGKIGVFNQRLSAIKQLKRNKRIDISISLLSSSNILNILSRQDDQVILSVRNYISKSKTGLYGRIDSVLVRLLYNKSDYIVAVSNLLKSDLHDTYRLKNDKLKTIYNPYNVELIREQSKSILEKNDADFFINPVIITVGRLSEQKGHWHLIRAFSELKKHCKDVKLVILGKGPLESYLKELVHAYRLDGDVRFMGFNPNPFKYISKAKLFVLPSLYEGFPNALCEAMACGIPVIASECKSGPREILSESLIQEGELKKIDYSDYGILVPVCDGKKYNYNVELTPEEQMLADSMLKLMTDETLMTKYAELAAKRVIKYSNEGIIDQWDKLLQQ